MDEPVFSSIHPSLISITPSETNLQKGYIPAPPRGLQVKRSRDAQDTEPLSASAVIDALRSFTNWAITRSFTLWNGTAALQIAITKVR
jgi:hypothetical protein